MKGTMMSLLWDLLKRLIVFFGLPYVAFWALATFVPCYVIPYTTRTMVSFWILVWTAQWLYHTIRHDDWSTLISRE